MRALLSTDWTNRVAFAPGSRRPHVESFFVKANDPAHRRAIWLRTTLFSGAAEQYAESWAIYFDPAQSPPRALKNRFPIERVTIDPERGGLGVGECVISDGESSGVVRGDDLVIAWRLRLDDETGPYAPLPARWMYDSRLVSAKTVTPHPSARVTGRIEIWRGRGRHSPAEVVEVGGWRGMQGHNWGKRNAERWAWCHSNAFDSQNGAGPVFFEALAATPGGPLPGSFSLGRLVLADSVYRFDTWRAMRAGVSEAAPERWRFVLRGPDGTLEGEASSRREEVVGLTYSNPGMPPAYCYNSKLAELTLKLTTKRGSVHSLRSSRAALEVGLPARVDGISVVL